MACEPLLRTPEWKMRSPLKTSQQPRDKMQCKTRARTDEVAKTGVLNVQCKKTALMQPGPKYKCGSQKKPRAAVVNHATSQRNAETTRKIKKASLPTLCVQANEVNWPHTMKEVITRGCLLPVARKHCRWKIHTKKLAGEGGWGVAEQCLNEWTNSHLSHLVSRVEAQPKEVHQAICNATAGMAFTGT